MRTVVSEKGQITIPKALRDSLGIMPGQELEFEESGGTLIARCVRPADPMDALVGLLPGPMDVDAFLTETRGPALDDEDCDHRR